VRLSGVKRLLALFAAVQAISPGVPNARSAAGQAAFLLLRRKFGVLFAEAVGRRSQGPISPAPFVGAKDM